MPVIQVNMLEGRSTEAKRRFAKEVTAVACDCLGVGVQQVRVIINEMPLENYAIAGELVADIRKNKQQA